MKIFKMFLFVAALIVLAGCSAMFFNERALSLQDVINLSHADVGDDIIKSQIDMTRSSFKLTPDDILLLKKEGVSEDVIKFMVESNESRFYNYGYSPYDYYYDYGYPYYGSNFYNYRNPYFLYRDPGWIGRFYHYGPYYSPGYRGMTDDNGSPLRNHRRPDMDRNSGNDNDNKEK
jgi:hypothetical protein